MENRNTSNSSQLAGLIGPSLIAITVSETLNYHIWAGNSAAGIHFNGAVLFVAGLAIVRAHNQWVRAWPVIVTLVGWFVLALGLFRMFAPELVLQGAQEAGNSTAIIASTTFVLAIGIYLTYKAYHRGEA